MERIHPVHQRLGELTLKYLKNKLKDDEAQEFLLCLKVNMNLCWEYAYLENSYVMAKMTNDVNWINEINIERNCI